MNFTMSSMFCIFFLGPWRRMIRGIFLSLPSSKSCFSSLSISSSLNVLRRGWLMVSGGRRSILFVPTEDASNYSVLREIKLLQELQHENVICLLDVFGQKSNVSLVFNFMDADLEIVIKDMSLVLKQSDVKAYTLMMLCDLEYLHMIWILHRSLKPRNLFVTSSGVLKLRDFGLAKYYGSSNRVYIHQLPSYTKFKNFHRRAAAGPLHGGVRRARWTCYARYYPWARRGAALTGVCSACRALARGRRRPRATCCRCRLTHRPGRSRWSDPA